MKKNILFLWLMLVLMGIGGFAQSLSDYVMTTGVDATKWITLSTTTNLISGTGDSKSSAVTDIGFTFNFAGTDYTQFSVNSDGNLRFGSTVTGTSYYTTPFSSSNANNNNPKINMLGCDGFITDSGYVYQEVIGSAPNRVCVIEFATSTYSTSSRNSLLHWQVQLYETTNEILIAYPSTPPPILPVVVRQPGMCVDNTSIVLIDQYHTSSFYNAGQSTAQIPIGIWPDVNRYYHFTITDCQTPASISVSNITTTEADIEWAEGTGASAYLLQYKMADENWEDADAITISNNRFFINGLTPNTLYDVRVAANCSDEMSNWISCTLQTKCVAISVAEIPYYEQFEGYASYSFPDCWTRINGYSSGSYDYPYISNNSSAHNGSGYLYLYNNASNPIVMALPPFEEDLNTLRLSFWMKPLGANYNCGRVELGFMSDLTDTSTFTLLHSWSAAEIGSTNWAYYEMDLDTMINGGNGILVFRRYMPGTSSYGWYFDDVKVMPIPTCEAPTELAFVGTSPYTVTLKWNPGEANTFNVFYKALNDEEYTEVSGISLDADSTYTLMNLEPATNYTIYVAAVCSDGSETPGDPIACATSMIPVELPYTTDFSEDSDQNWLLNNGNCLNYWTMGTIPDTTASALYITTNGTTPGYTVASAISMVSASKLFTIGSAPQVIVSFDVMVGGESTFDYIKLFLAPEIEQYPAKAGIGPSSTEYGYNSYSTYAFDFSEYMYLSTSTSNIAYKFNLTGGNKVHIDALIPNPYENPDENSTAQVVFAWRNDGGSGTQPGAIIYNVSVYIPSCPHPENPMVTNVTPHTANLTWDSDDATDWTVEYGTRGFTLGTGNIVDVTGNSETTLTGLAENTEYDVYVKTICNGQESPYKHLIFTTPCLGLTTLPQTWDFDNNLTAGTSSYPLPACWNRISTSNTTTQYPYSSNSNAYAISGTRSLYFYNSYLNSLAIMPAIDDNVLTLANLQLTFFARLSTANANIRLLVGVMDSPIDTSSFTVVDTIVLTNAMPIDPFIVKFDEYVGEGTYIAFKNIAINNVSVSNGLYIDDVTLEEIPNCSKALYLSATPNTFTADLTWMAQGEDFSLFYKADSDADYTEVQNVNLTDGVYTLTGLTSSTNYSWFVVSHCADTDYMSNTASFTTLCAPEIAPFVEDFDASATLPMCWEKAMGLVSEAFAGVNPTSTSSGWIFTNTYVFNAHHAKLNIYGTNAKYWLITPEIDLSGLNNPMLTFDLALTDYNNSNPIENYNAQADDRFLVIISTDNGTSWSADNSTEWNNSGTGDYVYNQISTTGEEIMIPLTQYAGQTIRIAFYGESTVTNNGDNDLHIDNVMVDEMPSCLNPDNLAVSNITTHSAEISWAENGDATSWQVEYGPAGFTPGTGTTITVSGDPSIVLNWLVPSTDYDFRVTAICYDGTTSRSTTSSFRTEDCNTISLPYSEDFDSYTESTTTATGVEPTCWTLVQEDVDMPDNKKPQLYYRSDFAHSGDYSLLLNYRGIYALPELSEDVVMSHVHLEMYLRQPNAAYQLEVGVWDDETAAFEPMATFNNSTTEVELVECDFSNYTGNGRRIAFHNVLGSGNYAYSYNYIDDISLTEMEGCTTITIEMHDSWGDGWTGNAIRIHTDGMVKEVTVNSGSGETATVPVYNGPIEFEWVNGTYPDDCSFTITGPSCLYYSGNAPEQGIFFSTEISCNNNSTLAIPAFSYWTENLCNSVMVHFENNSTDAESVVWNFGDGTTSEEFSLSHEYNTSGTYGVMLSVHNSNCEEWHSISQNVTITIPTPPINAIPYTEDFESYTESTTAATGVEPTCWELVQQDVDMTDAARPQLYYKSAFAHSGNYSLKLQNRGIYAMPELPSSIATSHVHLEMYLRQPNTTYQLQVGVWDEEDETFFPVATFNNETTEVEFVECDFSEYTGNGRRIAFRNILGNNANYAYSYNYLDDITLTEAEGCATLTFEMHDTYGDGWNGNTIRINTNGSVKEVTMTSGHDETVTVTVHDGPIEFEWVNGQYTDECSFTITGPCLYYSGNAPAEGIAFYGTEIDCNNDDITLAIPAFGYWTENTCNGVMVHFENESTDADEFVWVFGDETTSDEFAPTLEYNMSGTYWVTLYVHNGNCEDWYSITQDIAVTMPEPFINLFPYTENFDSYTTDTTVATGVEPTCWELVQEDVPMTDENRPQLICSSSYAHSDNYSLRLKYRGIYAMPELPENTLKHIHLEMYLKQPKSYYALEVGVWEDDGTFVPVATFNNSTTGMKRVECDFSSYTGNGRRIAFHNIPAGNNIYNYSYNFIDDITLTEMDLCEITVEMHDSYGDGWNGNKIMINNDGILKEVTLTSGSEGTVTVPVYSGPIEFEWVNGSYTSECSFTISGPSCLYYAGSYMSQGTFYTMEMDCENGGTVAVPDFTYWTENTCNSVIVHFENNSTDILSYGWNFGDNTGSQEFSPTHEFTVNGTYPVTLSVNNSECANFMPISKNVVVTIPEPVVITLPYSEDFDSYTASTTVATGVEPCSWELLQEDVPMTDENRPQLIYNSNYTHSGDYSLRLKYRGIYAMPPLSEDIPLEHLKLEMYLQQTKAYYALEVGIWEDDSLFVPVATFNNSTTGMELVECDFSNYTGNSRRIAFRNIPAGNNTYNYSYNFIDDITLTEMDGCEITIEMHDDFGDGWTGNKILVHNSGVVKEITLDNGHEGTTTVTVHNGPIEFEWVNGQFVNECYFTISGPSCLYYSGSNMSSGVFHTMEMNCDSQETAIPAFSWWKETTCSSTIVHFENNSTNADGAVWNFGDGTTSEVYSPIHEYTDGNTYTVTLSVRNSACENVIGTAKEIEVVTFVPVAVIDIPYSEDFESYTESTTPATGTSPCSWELVQEDVQMPDEKKPQLYYKSDFANSGNYSLLLNYRGVFAMPELSPNIPVNQLVLDMYLRQSNAAYRLEVGVWDDATNTFERVKVINNSTTDVEHVTCNFSNYSGNGRRIAFRNTLGGDKTWNYSYNYMDDITLTYGVPNGDAQPCPGNETVTDYDGNVYNTVKIGEQCWMKENLRVTHYADGVEIPLKNENTLSSDLGYCYAPNGTLDNVSVFGYLYNWPAVMHGNASGNDNPSMIQGVCPQGWHLPSDAEWTQFTDYVSSVPAYLCDGNPSYITKALASQSYWLSNYVQCNVGYDQQGNNATGFSAVPAGYVGEGYGYGCFGTDASFWSCSQFDNSHGTSRRIDGYGTAAMYDDIYLTKSFGLAVRCVLGEGYNLAAVTTNGISYAESIITPSSATCGGSVTYDGNTTVTARGVCWNTSGNPTVSDNHTLDGTGTGEFSNMLSGLTPGTTYYVRAYATNSMGTAYGEEVSFTTATCGFVNLPWYEDFEYYTTATTAATGIEPACWELVQEDVQMPDNKRPQLYYKSAFAHSGNYSLMLLNRGVYAMLEMEEDVSISQVHLEMYLRQPNAAYNLQAGIWEDETHTFVPVATFNNATTDVERVECDFSSYTGNGRRIAFRNTLNGGKTWDYSYNYLDDITLTEMEGENVCRNLAELRSKMDFSNTESYEPGDTDYRLVGSVVVTAKRSFNNYKIIQDSTAAILIYDPENHLGDLAVGDQIRDLRGHLINYFGFLEFVPSCSYQYFETPSLSIDTLAVTLAQLNDNSFMSQHQAELIMLENAAFTATGNFMVLNRYELSQNGLTAPAMYPYFQDADYIGITIPTDVTQNIVGFNYATVKIGNNYYDFRYYIVPRFLTDMNFPLLMVSPATITDVTTTTATLEYTITVNGEINVTECGVCWSTEPTPTVDDNHTIDGGGMGTFTSRLIGLMPSTTYYVRAYATNSMGTVYGEEVSFTTLAIPAGDALPCPGTPTVTDYDGNVYNTVKIGNQCWMKENLRVTHYADGTDIPTGGSSYTEPYYYDYSNHDIPLETRGYLYNWPAAMHGAASSSVNPSGVQGVCPTGWHLPSDAEWTQLTDYVSSRPEYTCDGDMNYIAKALASETGWNTYTGSCEVGNYPSTNNATGFSAVPAGYGSGAFNGAGDYALFWSSSQYDSNDYAWNRYLIYHSADVYLSNYGNRFWGYSVRCLRDETDVTENRSYEPDEDPNAVTADNASAEMADITSPVGVEESVNVLVDVIVYPNPTRDVVNVQCTMNNVQLEGIEVVDVYGKVVRNVGLPQCDSPTDGISRINVSDLAAGMYFVRVTTDKGAVTKPFVKR